MTRIEQTFQHQYGDDALATAFRSKKPSLIRKELSKVKRRRAVATNDSFKRTLGKKGKKLSRALWRGSLYYREDGRDWRNKKNGKIYRDVRRNPVTGQWEGSSPL